MYADRDLPAQYPPRRRRFEMQDHAPDNLNEYAFVYYRRLGMVKDHVDQNYHERLTLQSLANVAGLEKSYFSKFFRRATGICLSSWLSWVRVKHAVRLMRKNNVSITEVAYQVGFRDLRTFERATKRHTGHCPQQLKQMIGPASARTTGS